MNFTAIFLTIATFVHRATQRNHYNTSEARKGNWISNSGVASRQFSASSLHLLHYPQEMIGGVRTPSWDDPWGDCLNNVTCDPLLCRMYMPSYLQSKHKWDDSEICSPAWHSMFYGIYERRLFSYVFLQTDFADVRLYLCYQSVNLCGVIEIINESEHAYFRVNITRDCIR